MEGKLEDTYNVKSFLVELEITFFKLREFYIISHVINTLI